VADSKYRRAERREGRRGLRTRIQETWVVRLAHLFSSANPDLFFLALFSMLVSNLRQHASHLPPHTLQILRFHFPI
jgi:hypothetical protein